MINLVDVLTITVDTTTTVVIDENEKELARYDGRNSIPLKYNPCEVLKLWTKDNALMIQIDTSWVSD